MSIWTRHAGEEFTQCCQVISIRRLWFRPPPGSIRRSSCSFHPMLSLYKFVQNSGLESKEPELVGFPANEVVQLIRLEGEENNLSFWRQPAVIKGLETSLKERLALTGHVLEPEPTETKVIPVEPETPVRSPTSTKKGFGKRLGRSIYIRMTLKPWSLIRNLDGGPRMKVIRTPMCRKVW